MQDQCQLTREDFFAGDTLQIVKDLTAARLRNICRYNAWSRQHSAERTTNTRVDTAAEAAPANFGFAWYRTNLEL